MDAVDQEGASGNPPAGVDEEQVVAEAKSRPNHLHDKLHIVGEWTLTENIDSNQGDESDVELPLTDETPPVREETQTDADLSTPVDEDVITPQARKPVQLEVTFRTTTAVDEHLDSRSNAVGPSPVAEECITEKTVHEEHMASPPSSGGTVSEEMVIPTKKSAKGTWIDQAAHKDEFSWISMEIKPDAGGGLNDAASIEESDLQEEVITPEMTVQVESAPPPPPVSEEMITAKKKTTVIGFPDLDRLPATVEKENRDKTVAVRAAVDEEIIREEPAMSVECRPPPTQAVDREGEVVAEETIGSVKVSTKRLDDLLAASQIEFVEMPAGSASVTASSSDVEEEPIEMTPSVEQHSEPPSEPLVDAQEELIVPTSKKPAEFALTFPELSVAEKPQAVVGGVGVAGQAEVTVTPPQVDVTVSPPKAKAETGGGGVFGFFKRKPKAGKEGAAGSEEASRKKANSLDKKTAGKTNEEVEQKKVSATLPADTKKKKVPTATLR